MRSRDAERQQWFDLFTAQRDAFEAERERWQEERKFLLNAALAASSLEFTQRQRASAPPAPISSVPVEAKAPKPRPLGL